MAARPLDKYLHKENITCEKSKGRRNSKKKWLSSTQWSLIRPCFLPLKLPSHKNLLGTCNLICSGK